VEVPSEQGGASACDGLPPASLQSPMALVGTLGLWGPADASK
jgi:hypothetical protein